MWYDKGINTVKSIWNKPVTQKAKGLLEQILLRWWVIIIVIFLIKWQWNNIVNAFYYIFPRSGRTKDVLEELGNYDNTRAAQDCSFIVNAKDTYLFVDDYDEQAIYNKIKSLNRTQRKYLQSYWDANKIENLTFMTFLRKFMNSGEMQLIENLMM